jgi:integrase
MASVYKVCHCRDEKTKKLLGSNCPLLSKRTHGAWWGRYEAPPGRNGNTRRRPRSGPYETKKKAETAVALLESQAASGVPIPDRKLKVGAFFDAWLASKKSLRETTRDGYATHTRLYIKPGLGHLLLADLRESHLDTLYEALAQINRETDEPPSELLQRLLAARSKATWGDKTALHNSRPLTPARIRRVHATISSALSTAYKQKKIPYDPSKHVEAPTAKKRRPLLWTRERVKRWHERLAAEEAKPPGERRPVPKPGPVMVWTPDQCGMFLDLLVEGLSPAGKPDRLYPLYHLIATRGLRRSEAVDLEWVDTDLDDSKSVSVLEDEAAEEEDGIKSDSSRRVVLLDAVNIRQLKSWRAQQAAERLAAGEEWVDSGKVFTDELGRPIDADSLSKRFARLVRLSRLPPVRLHDLRHCAATLLLASGADMKMVSDTLGHRQYWFTADTYTLVLPELAEAAAEAAVAIIPRAKRVTAQIS